MSTIRHLYSCGCEDVPGRAEPSPVPVGRVAGLARYPVKSMGGERLTRARFTSDGVAGDRRWAVYTPDGGIASGKTTRRFRRVDGLLTLRARLDETAAADSEDGEAPLVTLPDGREYRADDPAAGQVLSTLLGRPLSLRRQSSVRHHDEAPVHLVTTAAVRELERLLGEGVDVARFRANLVLETEGAGFVEDDWQGRHLTIGDQVELCLGPGMPRCVMVGMPQPHDGLGPDAQLLKLLGHAHQVRFGLQAGVVRGGIVQRGDLAVLR
ncbi:MOSC domain-containing protein [Nonomuraea sp. SMC257]|uniref:MOSC domain-containing protein n=1 Tax=Nonomuraea montanisoli TaxID=2741721 RepID=A0A7Y6IDU1_9ACTN|nr:MOSC N-terminal beta barrel domain-containing protein [Nonomuraea montanisoli]NUW36276.1 MOSC domain-containing protein [Nonomuraea montanisoli]